jgi:hypothetical protein
MMNMARQMRYIGGIVLIVLAVVITNGNVRGQVQPVSVMSSIAQTTSLTCEQILEQAYDSLATGCTSVGRNQVCYANGQIDTELNLDTLRFSSGGDIVPIVNMERLFTHPLNLEQGSWGLSLFKLQANLPDTMPGQNVTFLVYGDTRIENASGDMQAFYFSSGLGSPECKDAPTDGILVRSPQHVEVSFNVNGVDIKIASTILLSAQLGQRMSVQLIEGRAEVSTAQGSQVLQPGQAVEVPLGGSNGLEAVGAPSTPYQQDIEASMLEVIYAAQQTAHNDDAVLSIPVEGCVTEIRGNSAIVSGYPVHLDRNLHNTISVGDCIRLDGAVERDEAGNIYITAKTPITVTPPNRNEPDSSGGHPGNSNNANVSNNDHGNGHGNSNGAVADPSNSNGGVTTSGNSNGAGNSDNGNSSGSSGDPGNGAGSGDNGNSSGSSGDPGNGAGSGDNGNSNGSSGDPGNGAGSGENGNGNGN